MCLYNDDFFFSLLNLFITCLFISCVQCAEILVLGTLYIVGENRGMQQAIVRIDFVQGQWPDNLGQSGLFVCFYKKKYVGIVT